MPIFPDFLPKLIASLTESTSISYAQNIHSQSISTPLISFPINTTFYPKVRVVLQFYYCMVLIVLFLNFAAFYHYLLLKMKLGQWIYWGLVLRIDCLI